MRRRRPSLSRFAGVVLGGLLLPSVTVGSFAAEIPRTPSGRPDLSGNYDISTLTPIQRREEHGERLHLSDEEAALLARTVAERTSRAAAASDPDRQAPPAGGNVGGYNAFYLDYGTTAMSVDGSYRTSILIDPPNGRFPPLTRRGHERREPMYPFSKENTGTAWWLDRERGPYDGPESLSIADRCILTLEATVPVYPKLYNNLKTIIQTDDHLMIQIEWMHYTRIIRIDDEHAPPEIRSRAGDSIGWWEGDTLVVETTNFLEEDWVTSTLFAEPSPPADQRVVERFERTADGVNYRFTVESGDWESAYTGELAWPETADKLYEYACHEGNYSVGNILRGARLLESEARPE